MGTIAETIFMLTLRQSTSARRVLVLLLIGAIPLAIAIASAVVNTDWDTDGLQFFIQGIVINTTLPLVALIVSAPVFADEIEEKTITNLMLSPIPRWQIAIPKLVAAILVIAVPLMIGIFVSIILIHDEDTYTAAIVAAFGVSIGAIAFASLFAFLGTITTRAVVVGVLYVFGFEALISTAIPGLKYVSISGITLSIMQELSPSLVDAPATGSNSLPPVGYAIVVMILIIVVANVATVWRLKRMDVH